MEKQTTTIEFRRDNLVLARTELDFDSENAYQDYLGVIDKLVDLNHIIPMNIPTLAETFTFIKVQSEGGIVIFKELDDLSAVFGKAVMENIPDFHFDVDEWRDEEAAHFYDEGVEDGDIDPAETSFDDYLAKFELDIETIFSMVKDGFKEHLKYYIPGDTFLYRYKNDDFFYVEIKDDDSIDEFIRNLNSITTKGYCYDDTFRFYGSEVITSFSTDDVDGEHDDTEIFSILQKIAYIDNKNSGYYWGAPFPPAIAQDYFYMTLSDFLKTYIRDYGYDVFNVNLDEVSEEKRALAYWTVMYMLEDENEKSLAYEQKYYVEHDE